MRNSSSDLTVCALPDSSRLMRCTTASIGIGWSELLTTVTVARLREPEETISTCIGATVSA